MFSEILSNNKVVPVVAVNSEQQAIDLTRALMKGGISTIEITLRTPCALAAIKAVKDAVPEVIVLAGTIVTPKDLEAVYAAGADGAISPAFAVSLVNEAKSLGIPFLPGVATPSEVLAGLEAGLSEFKLFPAAAVGGLNLLKSIASPLPMAKFCPTGGLTIDNFTEYLSLPNVICVGGSWMVPQELLKQEDWSGITEITVNSLNRILQS